MPPLSYTSSNYPFTPFTKIFSADINQCFADISTLLNTTKLNSTNIQTHGLTRYTSSSNLAAGTANFAVYNDANGDLTEAAQLPTAQGGLGFSPALSASVAGQTLAVNSTGTGLTLQANSNAASNIFNNTNFY